MAGRFRGAVGKVSKPKKSRAARKAKGKPSVALVRRTPKLSSETLQKRVAELTGVTSSNDVKKNSSEKTLTRHKILSQVTLPTSSVLQKPIGKAAIEIVGTKREKVIPKTDITPERTPAEAMGLKLLHRAIKNQSHNRLLPHQNRHDYEYRLRTIATTGVVQLFNSLAQARKAGVVVETQEKHLTADKVQEKKQIATKEAFFASLCQSRNMERY